MLALLAAHGMYVLLLCSWLLWDELAAVYALYSPPAEVMLVPSPLCSQTFGWVKPKEHFTSTRLVEMRSLAQRQGSLIIYLLLQLCPASSLSNKSDFTYPEQHPCYQGPVSPGQRALLGCSF